MKKRNADLLLRFLFDGCLLTGRPDGTEPADTWRNEGGMHMKQQWLRIAAMVFAMFLGLLMPLPVQAAEYEGIGTMAMEPALSPRQSETVTITLELAGGTIRDSGKYQNEMSRKKGFQLDMNDLCKQVEPPADCIFDHFTIYDAQSPDGREVDRYGVWSITQDVTIAFSWTRIYSLAITDGAGWRPNSMQPSGSAPAGERVTLRLDETKIPKGQYFDSWKVILPQNLSIENPGAPDGASFIMPAEPVMIQPVYKSLHFLSGVALTVTGYEPGGLMKNAAIRSETEHVRVESAVWYLDPETGGQSYKAPPWPDFKGGVEYQLEVILATDPGYSLEKATREKATVNAQQATAFWGVWPMGTASGSPGCRAKLSYSFPALTGETPMPYPNFHEEFFGVNGYDTAQIINMKDAGTLRYRMEGETLWRETSAGPDGTMELTGLKPGNLILVQKASGSGYCDSAERILTLTRHKTPEPSAFTVTDSTGENINSGEITGVQDGYHEWRKKGGAEPWHAVSGSSIPALPPGVYQIRVQGYSYSSGDTQRHLLASDPVELTVSNDKLRNAPTILTAPESFEEPFCLDVEVPEGVTVYFTRTMLDADTGDFPDTLPDPREESADRQTYSGGLHSEGTSVPSGNPRWISSSCIIRAVSCYQGYYSPVAEVICRKELLLELKNGAAGQMTATVNGEVHAAPESLRVAEGTEITLETAVPEGYLFTGWSDNKGNIPEPDKQKNPVTFQARNSGTVSPALAQLVDRIDVHVAPPVIGMAYNANNYPCIDPAGYPLATFFEKKNEDATWTDVADKAVFGPGAYRMGITFWGILSEYRLAPELKVFINGQEAVVSEPVTDSLTVTCEAYIETEAAPFFRDASADGAGLTLTPAPYYKDYTIVAADYDDNGRMGAVGAYRFTGEETGPITIPVRNFRMDQGRIFILDSRYRPVLSPQSPSGVP